MNVTKLLVVAALALAGSARAQLPNAAAVDQAKGKVDARAEGAEAADQRARRPRRSHRAGRHRAGRRRRGSGDRQGRRKGPRGGR